jgi:DNA-binding transcriptional LysR family regulator
MAALVSVAKAGGFSAASRETGIPLATLRRRVADLEAELGVPLLVLADRMVDFIEEPIDLALRIAELADSPLIARTVGTIRMVVSASPEYLGSHGAPKHPSDLAQHDCVAWSGLGPLNTWWFREGNTDRTFPIRTRFSTSSAESAIDAALNGLGLVQATAYQSERGVRDGGLKILLEDFECAPTPVSLVHAGNRSVPLKLRAFLDFAVQIQQAVD